MSYANIKPELTSLSPAWSVARLTAYSATPLASAVTLYSLVSHPSLSGAVRCGHLEERARLQLSRLLYLGLPRLDFDFDFDFDFGWTLAGLASLCLRLPRTGTKPCSTVGILTPRRSSTRRESAATTGIV